MVVALKSRAGAVVGFTLSLGVRLCRSRYCITSCRHKFANENLPIALTKAILMSGICITKDFRDFLYPKGPGGSTGKSYRVLSSPSPDTKQAGGFRRDFSIFMLAAY